ncbi:MAG: response regulator [Sterolibacterium sp.]|nr:response regulator [Sterolibacterium sp.]
MPVKKIMVVDDSPTERLILADLLTRNGYVVVTADSGEQAIALARQELPDLILMDVVMPGINGFQATRTIAREEATRHIPIIMCTSKDQATDKIWGMRQGAQDYLVKPADPIELLAKLASMG